MKFIKIEDKKTLGEKVYDKLKELIIDGELERGSKITETSIAKMFDVSPTPVREAFRRLASEELIEVTSWKGVIIKGINQKDILEIYKCREALEGMVGRLAAQNLTEENIEELNEILEESKIVKDTSKLIELNTRFHKKLVEISKNRRLKKMLDDLMSVILYDRTISNRYITRRNEILNEHIEIFNHLKKREEDIVANLMERHVRNGYDFIKKYFK